MERKIGMDKYEAGKQYWQKRIESAKESLNGVIENHAWLSGMEDLEISRLKLKHIERRETVLGD